MLKCYLRFFVASFRTEVWFAFYASVMQLVDLVERIYTEYIYRTADALQSYLHFYVIRYSRGILIMSPSIVVAFFL